MREFAKNEDFNSFSTFLRNDDALKTKLFEDVIKYMRK
ncbi:UNVERIFIED_ORG: hypothetical protein [Escherichia phage CMSTMSU]